MLPLKFSSAILTIAVAEMLLTAFIAGLGTGRHISNGQPAPMSERVQADSLLPAGLHRNQTKSDIKRLTRQLSVLSKSVKAHMVVQEQVNVQVGKDLKLLKETIPHCAVPDEVQQLSDEMKSFESRTTAFNEGLLDEIESLQRRVDQAIGGGR